MWRIIWYFLGWQRVRMCGASPQWSLNALAQRRVAIRNPVRMDEFTVEMTILRRDLPLARSAAVRAMCELEVIESGGFGVTFAGVKKRWALLVMLALAVAAALVLSRFVLFYTVEGNETIPDEQILRELRELGVRFGTHGPSIKPQWVKNHMLTRIPKLQWITITQNGCCARVIVRERPEIPNVNNRRVPRNVIASRAGVLTRVEVLDGNALCKVGDVVSEGQLLVSAYTDWKYKVQVSGALAEIYAQTWRRGCGVLPDETQVKTENGEMHTAVSLVIGRIRWNIFGNSGIPAANCAKITTAHTLCLPGGYCFPVTLEITRISGYDTHSETLSDACAQAMMQQEALDAAQRDMIAGVITAQKFTMERADGQLRLYSVLSCEEMIARMVDARIFKDDADANG